MDKIWVIRSIDRGWDGENNLLCFRETEAEARLVVEEKNKNHKELYPKSSLYFDYIEISK